MINALFSIVFKTNKQKKLQHTFLFRIDRDVLSDIFSWVCKEICEKFPNPPLCSHSLPS